MADTYTQLYAHVVFRVKGLQNHIHINWEEELHKYMYGIINNKGQKLMVINGMHDHIHILIGFKPSINISNIVRDIKANSSRFINENSWVKGKFEWQSGFGAFTVGYSQVNTVIDYIKNQKEHHKKRGFKEEYISFLKENGVDYKPEYLFD